MILYRSFNTANNFGGEFESLPGSKLFDNIICGVRAKSGLFWTYYAHKSKTYFHDQSMYTTVSKKINIFNDYYWKIINYNL